MTEPFGSMPPQPPRGPQYPNRQYPNRQYQNPQYPNQQQPFAPPRFGQPAYPGQPYQQPPYQQPRPSGTSAIRGIGCGFAAALTLIIVVTALDMALLTVYDLDPHYPEWARLIQLLPPIAALPWIVGAGIGGVRGAGPAAAVAAVAAVVNIGWAGYQYLTYVGTIPYPGYDVWRWFTNIYWFVLVTVVTAAWLVARRRNLLALLLAPICGAAVVAVYEALDGVAIGADTKYVDMLISEAYYVVLPTLVIVVFCWLSVIFDAGSRSRR